jgi:hypothetical protein
VLIAAGQVVITGEVTTVGYRQLFIAGQVAGPAARRDAIEPRVQVTGQAAWYRGENPRVFYESISLGPDFFRLLADPVTLIVLADLTITDGVTEQLLMEKVTGISVFGDITGPPELIGAMQVLTTDVFGTIRTADGLRS